MESATLNVHGRPLVLQGLQIGRSSSHFKLDQAIAYLKCEHLGTSPMLLTVVSHLDFASTAHVALPRLGHCRRLRFRMLVSLFAFLQEVSLSRTIARPGT